MPCHMMKLFGNFKTAKMSFAFRPWEFESLMQPPKDIFFVVPTQSKGHLRGSFLRWRERSSFVGEAFRLPFITGGFSGGETPPLRKAESARIFAAGEYPDATKRRKHICKQMRRRPANADSRGRLSLQILCAFPRRDLPQSPCNLPDFMIY